MSQTYAIQDSVMSPRDRRVAPAVRAAVWSKGRTSSQTLAECLEARMLMSTNWFVSPGGSDQNPGTLNAPFQTIQAAADIARPGDFVEIETGTYHETVAPAHSGTASDPITFEAYNGESVTITGADTIAGWNNYSGNINVAPMPWDLGEGQNQVFVNGKAINEARWPNTTFDLMHPQLAHAASASVSGNSATIYDPNLTQANGYWDGAVIHFTGGQLWDAQTGVVTDSAPGRVTFSFSPLSHYELPNAGTPYYLTGTFKALNSAGEWYRDPTTNQLYLWTPGGEDPSTDDIEVKARKYAFDLSNRANITINDVNLFAATVKTTGGSNHTVINGITATYTGQFVIMPDGWLTPPDSGIELMGSNSILANSTIAWSSGDGVFVGGPDSRVTNNVIYGADYNGGDAAGVRTYAHGTEIDHNTIYDCGRDGILHDAANVKILYNTVHDCGQLTTDCGAIYSVNTNGQGAVIAYNTVYGMHGGGFHQAGIYLDNNSSNFIVHDNLVYDVDDGLKLNVSSINENLYNNSVTGSQYAVCGNLGGAWTGTVFANNVLNGPLEYGQGVTLRNNSTSAIPGNGPADFVSGATGTPPDTSGGSTSTGGSGSTTTTGGTKSSGGSTTSGGTTTGGTSGKSTGGSSGTSGNSGSSSGTGKSTGGSTTGGTSSGGTGGSSGSTTGGSSTGTGTSTGDSTTSGGTSSGTSGTTSSGSGSTTGGTSTGTSGTTSGSSGSTTDGSSTGTSTSAGGSSSSGTGGTTSGGATSGTSTGTSTSGTTTDGTSTGGGTSTGSTSGTSGTASGGSDSSSGTSATGGTSTASSGDTSSTTGTGTTGTSAGGSSTTGSTASGDGTSAGTTSTSSDPNSGTSSSGNSTTTGSSGTSVTNTTTVPVQTGSSPVPTVAELLTTVTADRAAIGTDEREAKAELSALIQAHRRDMAASQRLAHELVAARRAHHRVGTTIENASQLANLLNLLSRQRQAAEHDSAAITATRHADQLKIANARSQATADERAYKLARRKVA